MEGRTQGWNTGPCRRGAPTIRSPGKHPGAVRTRCFLRRVHLLPSHQQAGSNLPRGVPASGSSSRHACRATQRPKRRAQHKVAPPLPPPLPSRPDGLCRPPRGFSIPGGRSRHAPAPPSLEAEELGFGSTGSLIRAESRSQRGYYLPGGWPPLRGSSDRTSSTQETSCGRPTMMPLTARGLAAPGPLDPAHDLGQLPESLR